MVSSPVLSAKTIILFDLTRKAIVCRTLHSLFYKAHSKALVFAGLLTIPRLTLNDPCWLSKADLTIPRYRDWIRYAYSTNRIDPPRLALSLVTQTSTSAALALLESSTRQ